MAHGTPDWGLVGPKQTVYGLDDLGEGVVRLGSPALWDRRGDVIMMDTYENGIGKSITTALGTGGAVHLASDSAWHGTLSLELVAGSDGARAAFVHYPMPHPVEGVIGAEVWFGMHADTDNIILVLEFYDGTDRHAFEVQYSHTASTLSYFNAAGGWTVFATGVVLYDYDHPVHVLKMVVDRATDTYVRAIVDDTTYLMAEYVARVFADATLPHLDTRFQVMSTVGNNATIYCDSYIVTQNEPV